MLTGEQYRESLRDGRETYYLGKRIDDITVDPDLSQVVDAVADGYDKWYQPGPDARRPAMGPPRSKEDLRSRLGGEHEPMAGLTLSSLGTLVTAAGRLQEAGHPDLSDRIIGYVDDAQRRDIRITECITDAKGDRTKKPSEQDDPDSYVHVVDRTPDGVVIRGAKLHITGASFGHDL